MKDKILEELKEALENREPNGKTIIETRILRDTIDYLDREKSKKLVCKDGKIYEFKEV